MSLRRPTLLVISGLPGSGKSTLAGWVAARRPAVILSVDPIARSGAALRIVVCEVDAAVQAARLSRRDRGLASGEPTKAAVEARRAEWADWPEPHLRLHTEDGEDACVLAVLDLVEA